MCHWANKFQLPKEPEKAFLLFHIFIRFNEFLLPKFCSMNGCWNILHFVALRECFSQAVRTILLVSASGNKMKY